MNQSSTKPKESSVQLLPHQVAFVDGFFQHPNKQIVRLHSDVGLGTTTALIALVSRLLQHRPAAKILLLAPAALRLQFVERLRSAGVPALAVDRYQFREMIDSASGLEIWPTGAISVLSRDLARQDDIGRALGATRWDLLIVSEANQFEGPIARRVLRSIVESSDRVILSTAIALSPDFLSDFDRDSITNVKWRRDEIVDMNGALLVTTPRLVSIVWFTLSPAELNLAEILNELVHLFRAGTKPQHLIAKILQRSLQSSPAAIESPLARIRDAKDRVAHARETVAEASEEDLSDESSSGDIDLSAGGRAPGIASRALSALESSSGDSKLTALDTVLGQIDSLKTLTRRIAIVTEYRSTLFYLAAEIESRGQRCDVLHGGMNGEERRRGLSLFASNGGILVATIAVVSESTTPREVTDLIFYDVPGSPATLKSILAHVAQIGRRTQLNIHVLVPSNDTSGIASASLELLRRVVGTPDSGGDEEWLPNT